MLNSSTTPKLRKKKLEEAVLTKSKKFVKDPPAVPSNVDFLPITASIAEVTSFAEDISKPLVTKAKMRKPRHDSEEGKKFLRAKAKALALEQGTSVIGITKNQKMKRPADDPPENDSEPPRKKSKKGKKKRKKSKSQGQEVTTSQEKRPETEERQRNESLAYLQLWSKHRDHWKFEKLKQMWLLKHAVSVSDMDDKFFKILLQYISSAKGAAKVKTLQEMQEVMAAFEKKYGREEGSNNPNSVFSNFKPEKSLEEAGDDERKEYDRAREIVQILSDN